MLRPTPVLASLLALLALLTLAAGAVGQVALVRDLATGSAPAPVLPGATPLVGARLGGAFYFAGHDALHGTELWRTDGTAAGTALLIDLCPGRCSSSPAVFTPIDTPGGKVLYFVAADGATGRELWRTDGTVAGTRLVRDVARGPASPFAAYQYWGTGQPPPPVAVGEAFFFPAAVDGATTQLWKSDGTWSGTVAVTTTFPAEPNPSLWPLAAAGERLLFVATDRDNGRELWTSDGTAEGTHLLRDFCSGACWGEPRIVGATSERVLIAAHSTPTGPERLWTIAGDAAPVPFKALCASGCYAARSTRMGADLVVTYATDSAVELWRTGLGERPSTRLGVFGVGSAESGPTTAANRVFFTVRPVDGSEELWLTDGTGLGTVRIAVIGERGAFSAGDLAPLGGGVIFMGFTTASGFEPWTSDGTTAGTRLLADLVPGAGSSYPVGFTPAGGRLLFTTSIGNVRTDLWISDGSANGTVRLDGDRLRPASGDPRELASWRGALVFSGPGSGSSHRLWRSDGTEAGTAPLDLGTEIANPTEPRALGDELFFAGDSETAGWSQRKLFRTAGTPTDTALVPGDNGDVHGVTPLGGALFFLGNPPGQPCPFDHCAELHRLAPGAGVAELLRDINPNRAGELDASSEAHDLTPIGDRLYFGANDGEVGDEPWVSDGTPAGTRRIADLIRYGSHPDYLSSHPHGFVALADRVLFATEPSDGAPALWRTDGSEAGTSPLQLASGAPVRLGDRVYFLRTDSSALDRTGLWASDGTAAGSAQVSPLSIAGEPGFARQLIAVGPRFFFTVSHRATGEELWASDGTAAGTRPLEVAPGPRSATPQAFLAVGNDLLFAATDGASGLEPWVSDGTPSGTHSLQDLAPGPDASSPADFTRVGDSIFFSASDRDRGRELWSVPVSALRGPICVRDAHTLCLQDRFAISVRWRTGAASSGVGTAVEWGRAAGSFWFFGPGNVELLVKVLDGRAVNSAFWFYSGALSDVEYWIDARDVVTGRTRTFHNPRGNLCGLADVTAFPDGAAPTIEALAPRPATRLAPFQAATPSVCAGDAHDLCLGQGRYRVEVSFADPLAGGAATLGHAMSGSDQTGFFWFFGPDNPELAVKVLDGRGINGHVWVFYSALSDVEYTLQVTDTQSGAVRIYANPRGRLCGGADTAAF